MAALNILKSNGFHFRGDLSRLNLPPEDKEAYARYKHEQALRKMDGFFLCCMLLGIVIFLSHMAFYFYYHHTADLLHGLGILLSTPALLAT